MSDLITVDGTMTIQDATACPAGVDSRPISLGASCCGGKNYQTSFCAKPVIATAGNVGDAFIDLAVAEGLTQIELLHLVSTAEIALRLYAVPASAVATAGVYPTTFAGAETLITTIDGVAVTTTFLIGDQTLDQVVARINAAMALEGIATPRASAVSGQLRIDGVETALGAGGIGELSFAGTGSVQLGMNTATLVAAQGQDVYIYGTALLEFPTTGLNLLTTIQISGVATVDVLAAGRSS